LGAVLVVTLLSGAIANDVSARTADIWLEGRRVSARITGKAVSAALDELADLAGAVVEWRGPISEEPLSAQFDGLSVPAAVDWLLRGQSHFLVCSLQGDEPTVRRIVVFGRTAPAGHPDGSSIRSAPAPTPTWYPQVKPEVPGGKATTPDSVESSQDIGAGPSIDAGRRSTAGMRTRRTGLRDDDGAPGQPSEIVTWW
jgi:hypothetical protein